jgi:dihydroneopterin aldolase/2-amino-4-hydroxy-6-hydroxymethyldihydropteridine diphosphokinase
MIHPDRLILHEMRFVARHGLLPIEKERAQPFIVSVELETSLAAAGLSDHLDATIDYRTIQRLVRDVIEGSSRRLIETLAEAIAGAILASAPPVSAVTVEVTKPRPPVDFQFAGVAARIRRLRPRSASPRTAFIGLGSNLGDRKALLASAVDRLAALPDTSILATSGVRDTEPVGPVDQPRFLNQVIALRTLLAPEDLMASLLAIEAEFGRVRTEHWGPRTLDLDLLIYEGETRSGPFLTVPHPRMWERTFVTEPLRELLNDARLEAWGDLRQRLGQ